MTAAPKLPESVARCLDPAAPEHLRIAVAEGLIPLAPAPRLLSLTLLLADPAEEVRQAARAAWRALPSAFLADALGDPELPETVLDVIAVLHPDAGDVLQAVLEHPALGPRTLARFVDTADEGLLARAAQNHRVLDRQPDLAERLLANPHLHPEDRGRLVSRYAPERDSATEGEAAAPAAEEEGLPPDLPAALVDDEPGEAVTDSQNLYQLVQSLSVADKIKLATMGSKGARRLLIRDTNKIVATAVIKSPKIREDEVQAVAQDRTVPEEVIRLILQRKDWLKNYPIRFALCQNPKTPTPRALRLLETLQDRDLRTIAKSRNVPTPVSTGAVRLLARRGKT